MIKTQDCKKGWGYCYCGFYIVATVGLTVDFYKLWNKINILSTNLASRVFAAVIKDYTTWQGTAFFFGK